MISRLMLTLTKQVFDNQLIDLHIFIEKIKVLYRMQGFLRGTIFYNVMVCRRNFLFVTLDVFSFQRHIFNLLKIQVQ